METAMFFQKIGELSTFYVAFSGKLVNNLHLTCPLLLSWLKPINISWGMYEVLEVTDTIVSYWNHPVFIVVCSVIEECLCSSFVCCVLPAAYIYQRSVEGRRTMLLCHQLAEVFDGNELLYFHNSIAMKFVWHFIWTKFQSWNFVTFCCRHTVGGSWPGNIAWCAGCSVVIWESQGWMLSSQGDPSTWRLADQP